MESHQKAETLCSLCLSPISDLASTLRVDVESKHEEEGISAYRRILMQPSANTVN